MRHPKNEHKKRRTERTTSYGAILRILLHFVCIQCTHIKCQEYSAISIVWINFRIFIFIRKKIETLMLLRTQWHSIEICIKFTSSMKWYMVAGVYIQMIIVDLSTFMKWMKCLFTFFLLTELANESNWLIGL